MMKASATADAFFARSGTAMAIEELVRMAEPKSILDRVARTA
jgi:hypothetical protein